jgi:hypothetical protein
MKIKYLLYFKILNLGCSENERLIKDFHYGNLQNKFATTVLSAKAAVKLEAPATSNAAS